MRRQNAIAAPLAGFTPQHFGFAIEGGIATVTLNRPEKKNPLTFESYRELTDFFAAAQKDEALKALVVTGAGGNFSSGGDVFEIIGPLVAMDTKDLLKFTRMTGELVKTMRACPQPIVAAIDGICAGAGRNGSINDSNQRKIIMRVLPYQLERLPPRRSSGRTPEPARADDARERLGANEAPIDKRE